MVNFSSVVGRCTTLLSMLEIGMVDLLVIIVRPREVELGYLF